MRAWSHRLRAMRRGAQRGSAALFVAMFAPAMIFMAGLVIDGGSALEARQRASDTAEQAARAAVQECDEGLLRSLSECRITDLGRARRAAERYRTPGIQRLDLAPISPAGQGWYGVRVSVTITFRTTLIGIIPAFRTVTVTESADAIAVTDL